MRKDMKGVGVVGRITMATTLNPININNSTLKTQPITLALSPAYNSHHHPM